MGSWTALDEELAEWSALGRTATLWWRDDDAGARGPALDRLLELAAGAAAALALAAIPARADQSLARALDGLSSVDVLQHGYAHRNHARAGERAAEVGASRPLDEVEAELRAGWRELKALVGSRLLPVFVPPWNRIAGAVVARLPALGFRALSTFGPRAAAPLAVLNCHCDIIRWRGDREFVGEEKALGEIVRHLRARRVGEADPDEATGLLTHHLAHDPACWRFVERLLAHVRAHPAARWISVAEALWPARS